MHFPWPDSYCRHCGAKALRLSRTRAGMQKQKHCTSPSWLTVTNSSLHPAEMDWTAGEPLLHSSAGKGSRRECCFPQAKDRRQSSPLLLAEEQEWHFPTYFPLCWPYQHGRQHATKPQRKQTCNENRHAAKNARRKQFWLGGSAWGDGGPDLAY